MNFQAPTGMYVLKEVQKILSYSLNPLTWHAWH